MSADLDAFLGAVRARTEARLRRVLGASREHLAASAPAALPMLQSAEDLTLRGGKRLRPALLHAAARAAGPVGDADRALEDLGAALELFQTYLLIHDDWMDGDALRRGAPSVHAALADTWKDPHVGACTAILAGNLLSGIVHDLVATVELPGERHRAVLQAFATLERDVIVGQCLDVLHHPDVEKIHDLKTGSYTVQGPIALGLAAVGAAERLGEHLARFARPLGLAFQLRDDLLGAFGSEAETGKPVGGDFREGKQTWLTRHALQHLPPEDKLQLSRMLGHPDADTDTVRALLLRAGARDSAEARVALLGRECLDALQGAPLDPEGASLLAGLARRITERAR
ncbi:MAG: polyprenyl synthetase family protein [Deltaproteobacteria bacterium]|nr:polyprenyl synthetase family protein [Deltaproteobacteria bacterium]